MNSVVARKHGDDEKMTSRARARAMMKWINLLADLEGRNVCAIFNKSWYTSLLEGVMPKSRVATK